MNPTPGAALGEAERRVLRALADSALPGGARLPGVGEGSLTRLDELLRPLPAPVRQAFRAGLWGLEHAPLARHGRRFSRLSGDRRLATLEALGRHEASRLALRGLLAPLKVLHFGEAATYEALGLRHQVPPPAVAEHPRWEARIHPAADSGGDLELECEVVVVGTGAGGGPVAAALAERGVAVLLLEEGRYHPRGEFDGRPVERMRAMYRDAGVTVALGNAAIPVPVGRGVGGTTLINSGTCFKTPDAVLLQWAAQGLDGLSPDRMAPYQDRVWQELQVAPSSRQALGRPAELIARGARALGWSHRALDRNAPGCDGQGLCCFGCPTDAKRSSNVSWVPRALERGAELFTGVKVEGLLLDGDRVIGVRGRADRPDGPPLAVTVHARIVVLACGSLGTPALLLSQGLGNGSGQLGRNLSLHPAVAGMGLFEEPVQAALTVPQGYLVDQFKDEGITFEGASVPLEILAGSLWSMGPAFTAAMERFDQALTYGFMVKDQARGRVSAGRDGAPVLRYHVCREDLRRLLRGVGLLARLLFAAGADTLYLPVQGGEGLRRISQVDALLAGPLRARHLDLSAYHPLGTARMGRDPFRSVIGPEHESHDLHNLYICDGAAVPGPPGVNPQVTIMAMALRAADAIAQRLERL